MFGIAKISGKKKAVKITDNLFVFREFPNLDCNVYMLKNDKSDGTYELMLIDTGNGLNSENLIQGIEAIGFNPEKITKIAVTHEHLDHILGVFNLPSLLGIKPEVYALGDTYTAITTGNEEIIAPRILGIGTSVFGVKPFPSEAIELKEGDILDFGPFSFEILHTPGHSNGSMTLYEPELKALFPGDVVFTGGSFGRFDFPGGSLDVLKNSIKRLSDLEVKYLCPGHMNYSTRGTSEIKKSLWTISTLY